MDAVEISGLVDRARAGDASAWNTIVDEYANVVWATVRRFRLCDAEAADAVQGTWLRLIEHLDAIHDPARIAGWLRTTARRVCLERLRETSRVIAVDPHESNRLEVRSDQGCATPEVQAVVKEEVALVRRALATLEERDRTLLTLLTSPEDLSYREISTRLGIPIGSVGPTRGRALERLRDALAGVGIVDFAH